MSETTSATSTPAMLTGLFRDPAVAERAFRTTTRLGYARDEINIVIDDDVRRRYFPKGQPAEPEFTDKSAEAGELGGPMGGTLGTLLAAVTAVGTVLLLPGLGFVVAGPVAAALAGAGAAAAAGGLISALHDWGIPQERIDAYEAAIKRGGILMGVKPHSAEDAQSIAREWKTIGAEAVHSV